MICTTSVVAKIKRATSFLNKRSGTQFYHEWKPMQSIIDILHKNFQEDHTNSRRFPGFPEGFLNSSRFPGVVDTLYTLSVQQSSILHGPCWRLSDTGEWSCVVWWTRSVRRRRRSITDGGTGCVWRLHLDTAPRDSVHT